MLIEPERAMFPDDSAERKEGDSKVKRSDKLPSTDPTVKPTRSVRIPPPLDLTKTVVSDTHTVPSHVVPPVDSTAE